jgi:hypothetical protein
LRAALEGSPHREIRAQACYNLAIALMKAGAAVGAKASQKPGEQKSKENSSDSSDQPIDQSQAEAVRLFERMAEEYGDIKVAGRKNYADLARANLARLRPRAAGNVAAGSLAVSLEVGSVAPEIQGIDTEGRKLKLSDYRGKVVVLDFWGDW